MMAWVVISCMVFHMPTKVVLITTKLDPVGEIGLEPTTTSSQN